MDLISAAKYCQMAVDWQDAAAQYNYGLCLTQDRGVEKDLIAAADYSKQRPTAIMLPHNSNIVYALQEAVELKLT
jgi:TPR repeat protein